MASLGRGRSPTDTADDRGREGRSRYKDDDERKFKDDRDRDDDRRDRKGRRRSRSKSPDRYSRRRKYSRSRSRSKSPRKSSPPREKTEKSAEKQQQMQVLLAQLAQAQAQQANVQLRKLYVGNLQIGIGLKDVHVAEFFNTAMTAAGLANGVAPPVQSVWMSSEGKFAFVEFRTPQDATNAMMLDGALFHGRPLRIGRPAEMPNSKNSSKPNLPGMGMFGGGGFSSVPGISSITSIPAPLGTLIQPGSRPFAGLNPLAPGPSAPTPTKVLSLSNMVTPEDLVEDQSFQDIYEDVVDECGKFGSVDEVFIPRPSRDGSPVPGLGKIFVKYSRIEESQKASASLSGRRFAGRVVVTGYIEEEAFDDRRF